MSRTTVTLALPHGYELDDGDQPRYANKGDTVLVFAAACGVTNASELEDRNSSGLAYFILRKIKPREYYVIVDIRHAKILRYGFDSLEEAREWMGSATGSRAVALIEKSVEDKP